MFSDDATVKVPYFGEWAEGLTDARLLKDALAVLHDAVLRCADQDMRTAEVREALRFLERQSARPAQCERFRSALERRDPLERYTAARDAYHAIARWP